MSGGGICGVVGEAAEAAQCVAAMLERIPHRGPQREQAAVPGCAGHAPGCVMGFRGPAGLSPLFAEGGRLTCFAGHLAPPDPTPARAMARRLGAPSPDWSGLDGAFACAHWDGDGLTLLVDPFGARSLFWTEHGGQLYFASSLKQLLAVPDLPVAADPVAIHHYLTFSFVPAEATGILGVRRLGPGALLTWRRGQVATRPYFAVREDLDPALAKPREAIPLIARLGAEAVQRRIVPGQPAAVFLSGGIDSAWVTSLLVDAGVQVEALSLDFGAHSVEREQAATVAGHLGVPLRFLPVDGAALAPILGDLVWKCDQPFGDPVLGPQYMLGRLAAELGYASVWNGEGGDQLFGGWTNKPMVAAAAYGHLYSEEAQDAGLEADYLRSFHRFYGFEERLYTPELAARIGPVGQRRALLRPYLSGAEGVRFLHRLRLADIALRGTQNLLPRAERMAAGFGLDLRTPLFDRALAEAAFRLPPEMKLRGAQEKWVLKKALMGRLPEEIVWRRKYGMSVPIADWLLGPPAPRPSPFTRFPFNLVGKPKPPPLGEVVADWLSPEAVARRGWFRPEYVASLLAGQGEPHEARRRRLGERLWCLALLEGWLRCFVDGRGAPPGGL